MLRLLALLFALVALTVPSPVRPDAADIAAAARGVVRVVIMGTDGERVFPVSHGTGFAISSTRIVTNAHVIREAMQDDTLRIAIVPPDGDMGAYLASLEQLQAHLQQIRDTISHAVARLPKHSDFIRQYCAANTD